MWRLERRVGGFMSLAMRALLALVLMVGFYVLALGMAAFLLLLPVLEILLVDRIHLQLALLCVVAAGLIVWSILPRIDRFEAPGSRLVAGEHPKLFSALTEVAADTGQAMPAEVYLVPDINAFVTQRGGIMGLGSRRVMGLGLPLMQILTVPELRAVLAHEFGHFHGGDTALGPWVYQTRAAIGRTLQTLASTQHGFMAIVQLPFEWYGNLFLRLTLAVSRAQEYAADRLAAHTQGPVPLVQGLRRVHGAAAAFAPYWSNEVVPALQQGFRPPIAQGFDAFLSSAEVHEAVDRKIAEALDSRESNPFDSHPPLRDRIAAVEALALEAEVDPDDTPAVALLGDVARAEASLMAFLVPEAALEAIDWEDVGTRVYARRWAAEAEALAPHLQGATVGGLPVGDHQLTRLAHDALGQRLQGVPAAQVIEVGQSLLGTALAAALAGAGWSVDAMPGRALRLRRGDHDIDPYEAVKELATGTRDAQDWQAICEAAGITDLPLASTGATTAP